ncbi:hypothetical protein GCM10023340_00070 [Nocardioides marinquilinus]|uniref:DUF3558 domain-containing protein n=1 Tax=Nocardioides marinquilinus TaxID=1210400 RepID=A0ABP9P3J7_9ACTN
MRALPAALTLLAALALSGCGGDDDEASDPSASGAASDVNDDQGPGDNGAGAGACPFLSVEAVSEATGADAELVAGGPGGCSFRAGDATVLLSFVPITVDAEEYATGTRDNCETPVTDIEAGDIAFTCVGISPQGFVFSGGDSVVVDVTGNASDDDALRVAGDLLPEVQFPVDDE